MANGYITAADGGLPLIENDDCYVYFDARLPVQPHEWTDEDGIQRYRITPWAQITVDNSTGPVRLDGFLRGWNNLHHFQEITATLSAVWTEYTTSGLNPARPSGLPLACVDFEDTKSDPRHAVAPFGNEEGKAYINFLLRYTMGMATGEVLALHFEFENDNAFADSEPSSVRDYEMIGRNPATWSPYNKNESVSAWLLQRILAQNLNKILYQTKQCWTVPL